MGFIFAGLMVAVFCASAYATTDIQPNGNLSGGNTAANCTQPVLGTYSGSTNFEAKWRANTVPLRWYNEGERITTVQNAAKTCDYDGALTIPSTAPSRTGYTFGGWKVIPGLPAGYTELEYIHFDGTYSTGAYIDTGLLFKTDIPNTQIKIQADAKLYQGSSWQVIVGAVGASSAYIGTDGYNLLYYGYGSGDISTGVTNPYHRLLWNADAVAGKLTVFDKEAGAQIVNRTFTAVAQSSVLEISIGTYAFSRGSMSPYRAKMDLYLVKIYKQDTLKFNGIPAKRNSDNVVGLYDTVSGTFKTVPSGITAVTAGTALD